MFNKVIPPGTLYDKSGKATAPATPPPLPNAIVAANPDAMKRQVFMEKVNFSAASFDYGLIQKSHEKAEAWINANPAITIVQIQTFHSATHAVTVVWYR